MRGASVLVRSGKTRNQATEILQEQSIRYALPAGVTNERNWAFALRIVGRRKLSQELVAKRLGRAAARTQSSGQDELSHSAQAFPVAASPSLVLAKIPAEGTSWTVRSGAGTVTLNSIRCERRRVVFG